MVKAISLLILFLSVFPSYSYGADIYYWFDKNGTYHATDDEQQIPSAYRGQVKIKSTGDAPSTVPPAPSVPAPASEAAPKEDEKKDIYGSGEEWWKEKVRPLENQSKESSENYELTNKKVTDESENLIERRLGSHQQFKSSILEMDRLRKERAKYENQLTEAKKMLARISKEAEESEADPAWLKGGAKPLKPSSSGAADITADIYGRDETWWREKMSGLRQQLKESVENYDKVYKDYSKNVEELNASRFGGLSLTQYQMYSNRLDVLSKEMAGYQAKISEVKKTLDKLSKDAEESKANPGWLKEE